MIKVSLGRGAALEARADALVVFIAEEGPGDEASALNKVLGGILSHLASDGYQAKVGDVEWIRSNGHKLSARGVLAVGLGAREQANLDTVRRAGAAAARALGKRQVIKAAALLPDQFGPAAVRALAEGLAIGHYSFNKFKSQPEKSPLESVAIYTQLSSAEVREHLKLAEAEAIGMALTRDLVNEPAGTMTPSRLADIAQSLSSESQHLKVRIYDRGEIEEMGMGAFLGVSRGSDQPPKLIHFTYKPSGTPRAKVALVGKGLTFDAGGLNLKPTGSIEEMKYDMAGAAIVFGVMKALPLLELPLVVHGVVAATENLTGGSAYKPGDVLRSMTGKTIEIGNTDAEGRLTLADALAFAERQQVDEIVDMATLTGACKVALGDFCAGVMGHDQVVEQLLAASAETGELLWRLPLIADYKEKLKSDLADLNNISTGTKYGGAITAGLFLWEFVQHTPWAHIDLAGPVFTSLDKPHFGKGATGYGVRTILEYLRRKM